MRHLRLFAPLLVVLVLSAGCAELRGNIEAPPAPEFRVVLPWELQECRFAVAVMGISSEAIGGRMPAGFRVLRLDEIEGFPIPDQSPLPVKPAGDGNLAVELFACASGTGATADENVSGIAYGSVFSFVEPPEHLRDENATFHFLKWDVLIPDDARRAMLAAEGVPAVPGNVSFSRFDDVGPGKILQGLLQLDNDTYEFSGGGQPQGTDALQGVSFVEFTDVGGGEFVVWRTNVTTTQVLAGTGTLDLSGSSWVRETVGSDTAQAFYVTGLGGFTNGTIGLPWRE